MGRFDFLFKKEEVPMQMPKAAVVTGVAPSAALPPMDGQNNFHKFLDDEIRKRNTPGPDYLEFSDTLKALEGQPLDERTRYIVNYTTYQGLGLTADKIISSATSYLGIVDKEKGEFEQSLETAKAQKISAKEAEIQAEQKAIQDLSMQIQKKQENIQKLSTGIEQSKQHLQSQEMAFTGAYQARKALIEDHINKIKLYLYATVTK